MVVLENRKEIGLEDERDRCEGGMLEFVKTVEDWKVRWS